MSDNLESYCNETAIYVSQKLVGRKLEKISSVTFIVDFVVVISDRMFSRDSHTMTQCVIS